jgi:hypothetical protein
VESRDGSIVIARSLRDVLRSARSPLGASGTVRNYGLEGRRSIMSIIKRLAMLAAFLLLAVDAIASITVATRGVFTGRVSVSGKTPNSNYEVWQSTGPAGPAGNKYIDTGFRIDTDAAGNGTVSIPNTSSGTLHVGHNVKVGNSTAPNSQPARVVVSAGTGLWPGNWFATLQPGASGPHGLLFRQAVTDGSTTQLETWDAGTMISIDLQPQEASWINMGAMIVPHGDLQAMLVNVSPQSIVVQIIADPTHTTVDDLEIQGIGINVVTLGNVGVHFLWTGSTSEYLNNVFVQSYTWPTPQSYEFGRASVMGGGTTSFCGVDDPNVTQPCQGGFALQGYGCGNSHNAAGALLEANGVPAMDNVVFTSSGELTSALSVLLQGNTPIPAGVQFGDGVRCVGGNLKRLYIHNAVNGVMTAPQGSDPSVKNRSAMLGDPIAPGSTRFYQCYYRDPASVSGLNFNVTNAIAILWP